MEWIGSALDNGLTVEYVERRPAFNSLRGDDRYRGLVEKHLNQG
jgi:hypothetical protein